MNHLLDRSGPHRRSSKPKSDDFIEVLSGGSTGTPKRLLRPIDSWVQSAGAEASVFGFQSDERFAVLGSPTHSLWAYAKFRSDLVGSHFFGLDQLIKANLADLQSNKPTVLYGVPDLIALAARRLFRSGQTLPTVRRVLLGGGPMPFGFSMDLIVKAFPEASTWIFYGAAETSFVGYATPGQPYTPFPGVEVEVRKGSMMWVRSPMTISPKFWVNTGDCGRVVQDGRFEVLGRASRRLQVKGRKYPVEPIERNLSLALDAEQFALLQDRRGRVSCVFVSHGSSIDPKIGLLAKINHVIHQTDPEFPGVSRMISLEAGAWPLMPSGKTDWQALTNLLDAST